MAHHVRSHECTVSVIVLQEGNQSCCNRGNLLRSYVHELHFRRGNHGIVSILTTLYRLTDEATIFVQGCVTLTDDFAFFFFSTEIHCSAVVKIYFIDIVAFSILLTTVFDNTIWRFDEAEVVDFSIYAERRDQTNVWSFRAFNRTKTTIVSVVYVTHLEAGTFTRQTTRTECRKTTLVRYFSQGVGLVHEL